MACSTIYYLFTLSVYAYGTAKPPGMQASIFRDCPKPG